MSCEEILNDQVAWLTSDMSMLKKRLNNLEEKNQKILEMIKFESQKSFFPTQYAQHELKEKQYFQQVEFKKTQKEYLFNILQALNQQCEEQNPILEEEFIKLAKKLQIIIPIDEHSKMIQEQLQNQAGIIQQSIEPMISELKNDKNQLQTYITGKTSQNLVQYLRNENMKLTKLISQFSEQEKTFAQQNADKKMENNINQIKLLTDQELENLKNRLNKVEENQVKEIINRNLETQSSNHSQYESLNERIIAQNTSLTQLQQNYQKLENKIIQSQQPFEKELKQLNQQLIVQMKQIETHQRDNQTLKNSISESFSNLNEDIKRLTEQIENQTKTLPTEHKEQLQFSLQPSFEGQWQPQQQNSTPSNFHPANVPQQQPSNQINQKMSTQTFQTLSQIKKPIQQLLVKEHQGNQNVQAPVVFANPPVPQPSTFPLQNNFQPQTKFTNNAIQQQTQQQQVSQFPQQSNQNQSKIFLKNSFQPVSIMQQQNNNIPQTNAIQPPISQQQDQYQFQQVQKQVQSIPQTQQQQIIKQSEQLPLSQQQQNSPQSQPQPYTQNEQNIQQIEQQQLELTFSLRNLQEQELRQQYYNQHHNPDINRLKQVQQKLNDLYNISNRLTSTQGEYQLFIRKKQEMNELHKNYGIRQNKIKNKLSEICDCFREVRGDGNCFYTAFGFQYFRHLLNNFSKEQFEGFLWKMDQIISFSINCQQVTIESPELQKQCWKELKYRLQFLRNLPEDMRDEEFIENYSAYEQNQEIPFIDGYFYGLSTIFFRNLANYVVQQSEMKEQVFDQENLLTWGVECNSNEIIIQELSKLLSVYVKLLFFDDGSFKLMEYSKEMPYQIILLIRPGHYNIGFKEKQGINKQG